MSLFGGAELTAGPGLRVTTKVNGNGLRTTPAVPNVATTTIHKNNINPANGKPKLDTSDPRVRKLVYSMYRDMLTTYNDEANDFVSQKDPSRVKQDLGVGPILETIIVRQGSQQGGSISSPSIDSPDISNSTSTPSSVSAAPIATGGMPPPPPPPPLIPSGAIPAVRLNSEIGPRDKGPPMALANAMMKDKKPFTYTPGGIDLSEIRSPRMAKRIQMNAAAEGVTSAPEPRPAPAPPPGGCLPPAALAAMQPQMAIPVFPQGGFNPGSLHKTHKPSDFAPPPPPGPPPFMQQLQQNFSNQNRQQSPPPTRTPPPPPVRSSTPTTMPLRSPTPTTVPVRSPSPSVAVQLESRPVSNNNHNLKIVTNNNIEDRSSPTPTTPVGVGTGRIYIPPIETSNSAPAPQVQPAPQKPIQTKAQAHSQNLGSIYIPPIEQRSNERNQGTASSSSSGASDSPAIRSVTSPPTVGTPMTPLLNKAPTPWMNSYNRMQNQPPTTPPYVNPANIITPWGVVGAVRTIPISMAEDENDNRNNAGGNMGVRSVVGPQTGNARMIPIQIQREDSLSHQQQQQQQQQQFQQQQYQQQLYQQQQQQQQQQQYQQQTGTRTIPIQMEGSNGRPTPLGNQMPANQQANLGYQKRIVPAPYNNPMGLYSNQNAAEAYHKQAGEIHGMDRMSVSDDNRRTDPIQSKSLRVIQKVAEDELQRHEQRRMELMGDDKQLMDLFKAQVDDGSSLHQSEEPRFRGGHIPSRAFRVLQSNLPPSPGGQDQAPNYQTQAQNAKGNLTHNIQILMQSQPQSPTPQQQQTYQHNIQVQPESPGASGNRLPPSQQKVPEPKKYMGSNIPSRSFKILQAMTAEDESSASESEGAPADQYSYSSDENTDTSPYPYPYPYTFCNSNGQDPNNEQGQGYNSEYPQWPENFEGDPNWDPYNYMSWYYWWYYNSCYWNGYDMSGYEYPANWDPNYYPEGYSTDYSGYETGTEPYNQQAPEENVPIPSKSFKNLQKSYNDDDDMLTTGPDVPKIVIEGETCPSLNETETENTYLTKPDSRNIKMNACDNAKNVVHRIEELDEDTSSEDEDDYESCVEEQMVIKSETGSESNKGTENIEKNLNKTDVDDEDDEEDEETEPEDDDGDEGIVEEPETPSSEDSDAATLVDEVCYDRSSRMGGLTIEEYQSPTSDSCDSFFDVGRKNRLSTIEELTENERSRASSVLPRNLSQELELEREPLKEESEDEDDEDSESDSEDLSSVSVIENKSDTQGEVTTATESKREDETTSSDEDGDVEDDDGNDVAAVTVRLPLKLSFSKSKSYRDIATVLVCDSEVCSETETVESNTRVSQVMEVREVTEDGCDLDGNEPAVSYTISLSRSTSKNKDEEVVKNLTIHTDDEQDESSKSVVTVEESPDIDYWGQLGSSEEEKTKDFWETKKTSEERKSNDFSSSNPTSDYEPVSDFWGSLHKEKTRLDESSKDIDFWATTSEVVEEDSCKSAAKEEMTEPVEDYWGTINNSKSEEIVREKTDFASSEAKKSVSWDRQDTIDYKWDNEFNFWDKSCKSVETRRFSSNFEISEAYESDSGMRSETRKKKVDRVHHKRHSIHGSIWDTIKNMKQAAADAAEEKNKLEDELKQEEVSPPWMYWGNAEKEKANEIEKTTEKASENQNDEDSSSDDDDDDDVGANKDMNISVDVNLPPAEDSESESEEEEEDENENNVNDPSQFNGMLIATASRNDITKSTNNSTCHSDIEVTMSLNSRLSPAPHVSDENSDESSSKSSGTTIGRDKSDPERSDGTEIIENTSSRIPKPLTTESLPKEIQAPKDEEKDQKKTERPVEIRELKEKIKLSESSDLNGHEEEACTCHLADRMARAEGLLWRIERFLQESLSLGSEDDSGVMTDLSRQISDVDTDADNDNNDNEFLLTAAFAAKQKRSSSSRNLANKESNDAGATAANAEVHQPTCARNPNQNQQAQPKKRPTSEILVESYSKRETEVETETVKMRSASERKALRYQRAKTHSRLFQLLQDECSKEDDDDDDDYDYETETGIAPETQVVEKVIPIETEQSTVSKDSTTTTTSATTNASKEERRSRLIPLPIKNFLTSSLPCDSNSSPSGSSGVLSPTSPVNRDQLLADIINEFHLRHQQQNQKRLSNFPSKIFKLLQQEFGEEFYETFDCCADDGFHIPVSVDGNKHCQGEALVQECTIHKSESLKLLEEAAATKCSGSTSLKSKEKSTNHCRKSNNATSKCKSDSNTSSSHRTAATAITPEVTDALSVISAKDSKFLEVPLRRKKANLNRDPRSPRTKKS